MLALRARAQAVRRGARDVQQRDVAQHILAAAEAIMHCDQVRIRPRWAPRAQSTAPPIGDGWGHDFLLDPSIISL